MLGAAGPRLQPSVFDSHNASGGMRNIQVMGDHYDGMSKVIELPEQL